MHQRLRDLALVLNAAAYLPTPATAQFVTGPLEPATPALPHTAVYTTTLAQSNSPQAITTAVVTLIVPRDVGRPNNGSLVTGTAISHFSAAQQNGALSTWSETAELAWTIVGNNPPEDAKDAPLPLPQRAETTLTAAYTDYQHYSVGLYGAWLVMHYDFSSTIRETIVEAVGAAYPATIIRTGYTDIKVEATIAVKDGPTTTDPDRDSTSYVRTTTLAQVAVGE